MYEETQRYRLTSLFQRGHEASPRDLQRLGWDGYLGLDGHTAGSGLDGRGYYLVIEDALRGLAPREHGWERLRSTDLYESIVTCSLLLLIFGRGSIACIFVHAARSRPSLISKPVRSPRTVSTEASFCISQGDRKQCRLM